MIRTWAAEVSPLLDKEIYLKYYREVPAFRREKADKIVHQEGRALSIGAWALLEKMRRVYGVDGEAVYNLSHSGSYALCSIDDRGSTDVKLGCDVEKIKKSKVNVARHFFCDSEFRYVEEQETETEKARAFYRYWVLKESFMKATRLGMKLGLNEFEIAVQDGQAPFLIKQPEAFPQTYYFKEYELAGASYKAAVCSDCSDISDEIEEIILKEE